ncbi:1-aminocyclopropane-1-carboxylate oxidase-like 1, partial [Mucuna pruriens]
MVFTTDTNELETSDGTTYDGKAERISFDDSKTGVKGLLDSGVTKIPRMFYSAKLDLTETPLSASNISIPIIDLQNMNKTEVLHDEVVDQIRSACRKWGFFQVINHGIGVEVLDEMICGIRRFHEQDGELKKRFYSRDSNKRVRYFSNGSLLRDLDQPANWRDTVAFVANPDPPSPGEIPAVCRDIMTEYSKKIRALGVTILELLSEALGLDPSYLDKMDCSKALFLMGQYYPACPEPELTLGSTDHTDMDFMTILLQDQMGGLQVLHENQWINVPPVHGALIVNIGDFLQLMTNDMFISVNHRVLSRHIGPRISVASFFMNFTMSKCTSKVYGPIKELLSEENPPIYRDITMKDFLTHYYSKGNFKAHFSGMASEAVTDRKTEVQAFDNSKAGVKGVLDSGITKIPPMFHVKVDPTNTSPTHSNFSIPIIDLQHINNNSIGHVEVVDQIRSASQKWGFFQVINHGIPIAVLDEMISGIRRFHEQDAEARKPFYSRDSSMRVRYFSNGKLFRDMAATWRDTIAFSVNPHPPNPHDIPAVCRDIVAEYSKQVRALGITIFELLSEALDLNPSYLKEMDCTKALYVMGQYYPECPEPELTMGISKHTDCDFITILLQDQIGGLQVLHEDQWVNVPPVQGALVVNIGDILQLMTNDKFISVYHRVLLRNIGPRISVATFFMNFIISECTSKIYGPIKELLSEENPPAYRDITMKEILTNYYAKGIDGNSYLQPLSYDSIRSTSPKPGSKVS